MELCCGIGSMLSIWVRGPLGLGLRAPKDHIDIRIPHSGSQAQDKGRCRTFGL